MDPMAGGDPNAMPADPNAGMADPMAGGDPNAMGAEDPMAGNEEMPESNQDDGGDSTVDIINQLSPTDREAVRAYAESMLSRDETAGSEPGEEEAAPAPQGQDVMMEITKARLIKAQKRLNEMFGDMVADPEKDKPERKQKKVKVNKGGFKTPFDSPY